MAIIRQEVNIIDANQSVNSSDGTVTLNAVVQLDTTQYSGSVSYFYEIIANRPDANTFTSKLRRKGTTTDDATCQVTSGINYQRIRSSFTPPAGQTEYVVTIAYPRTTPATIKAARIIIIQT